jgi:hypothetical protein
MKWISIILFLSFTQPYAWDLLDTCKGSFKKLEVDEQGDLFITNTNKHLIKLTKNLDTAFVFNEKTAEVDFISLQNSLKILTFNEGLNTIQFLDKTLSPSAGEINLDESELPLVKALGVSRDNNFWVFDQDQQALKKLNSKLELISNSGNMINITSNSWAPTRLKEIGDKVYLCDSNKGVLEFDFFGTYIQTIHSKVNSNFYVEKNSLFHVRNDSLIIRDLMFHTVERTLLPQKNIKEFAYYKSQIYLVTEEKLYIYAVSE